MVHKITTFYLKFEKEKGVCVVADGKGSKGALSGEWAEFLCKKTPLEPLSTLNGLRLFIDHIWEEFYEDSFAKIKDAFERNTFENKGSFSTYTACWFEQNNSKTYYQWLSYGNSAVLIYDTQKDELFVPDYKPGLLGFLKNRGLINWKEGDLKEEYMLTSGRSYRSGKRNQKRIYLPMCPCCKIKIRC